MRILKKAEVRQPSKLPVDTGSSSKLIIFLPFLKLRFFRQQGKNYTVEDGDIIFFKFNAGAGLTAAKKK